MNPLPAIFALVCAPLMLGVINRTKAIFAGRTGAPLLQPYYDLRKLLSKGAVYSRTTSWVFRAGPVISLAVAMVATTLLPFGPFGAAFAFSGDLVLFAYLFGLGRFFTVAAALDTGSPFEGMGASREVFFSALSEPALLLGLAAVAREAVAREAVGGTLFASLTEIHFNLGSHLTANVALIGVFVTLALFIVLLTESSRMPVDDPTTHLELTMIHEVMVLDHSGPDLAFILYGAALKLWLLTALIVEIVVPSSGMAVLDLLISLASMFALAVVVGIVESTLARLRLVRVPQLLIGATTLSILALVLEYHAR